MAHDAISCRPACRPAVFGLALAILSTAALVLAPQDTRAAGFRSFKSGPVQITADGTWLWIADAQTDRVFRMDTRDDTVTGFDPDPASVDRPRGLSVAEDGSQVWVAAHDTDRIYVLDGADGGLIRQIDMPLGSGPWSVALSPPDSGSGRQEWAIVTLHRSEAVAVIDTRTFEMEILETHFPTPFAVAWTEAGDEAWVTHLMVIGEHPRLVRVDVSGSRPVLTTHLRVGRANPVSPVNNVPAEGGYLTWRGHPAQLPSTATGGLQEVWFPTQYANMNGTSPGIDSTIQSSVRKLTLADRVLSPDDKVILSALEVHDPVAGGNPWQGYGWNAQVSGPVDLAFFDVQGSLFAGVLHEQSNDLVVMPWDTLPWRSTSDPNAPGLPEIPLGDRPMGMAVSPTADRAFVYNALSSDISVVDLALGAEQRRVPLSTQVDPQDPRVRGALLFHTSEDDRISVNRKVACASCHIHGEHDGRNWAFQHTPPGTAGQGHGPRATIDLRGISLTHTPGQTHPTYGWGMLHHSGDRDEIQDFEHTFLGISFQGNGFLSPAQRQPELGPMNAGLDPDLDAIASYLLSLEPLARSPHRASDGSLTESAVRGATFFIGNDPPNFPADADCASCHDPDRAFQDFGFHDVGQRRDAGEQELNNRTPAWHVNTLSLVGVWNTPPINGVLRFAEEFFPALKDFGDTSYGRTVTHGSPQGLTGRQMADLAEFILSIDGVMAADPSQVWNARDTTPPHITRVEAASPTRVTVWFNESVNQASAGNAANYQILRTDTSQPATITAALWDPRMGDRVDLDIDPPLETSTTGVPYELRPTGVVFDAADSASVAGGTANGLDLADPRNIHSFVVSDVFTVTLGASGYENVTLTVHDASPIQGLNTWSHDRVFVTDFAGQARTPGFVRFDWSTPFVQVASTPSWTPASTDILDARFTLVPQRGDVQEVELRRVLQPWSDPNECDVNGVRLTNSDVCSDFNNTPVGGPTWNSSAHGSNAWNQSGARSLGGTGAQASDYNAGWDLSGVVDATATPTALGERVEFSGAAVTDAFRFWFENPSVDYGYALRINRTPPANPHLVFYRWEDDLRENGPVLALTYQVPATTTTPVPEVSGAGAAVRLRVRKTGGNGGDLAVSFEDLGGSADTYNLYEGSLQPSFDSHVARTCHASPASPAAGVLEMPHTVLPGTSLYILVTGSNTNMEGTAGFASDGTERNPARLTCGPN